MYCGIQLYRKRCGRRQQWIIWWFCVGNCTHIQTDYDNRSRNIPEISPELESNNSRANVWSLTDKTIYSAACVTSGTRSRSTTYVSRCWRLHRFVIMNKWSLTGNCHGVGQVPCVILIGRPGPAVWRPRLQMNTSWTPKSWQQPHWTVRTLFELNDKWFDDWMTFKRVERSGLAYVKIIFQDLPFGSRNKSTDNGREWPIITQQGRNGIFTCIIAGD